MRNSAQQHMNSCWVPCTCLRSHEAVEMAVAAIQWSPLGRELSVLLANSVTDMQQLMITASLRGNLELLEYLLKQPAVSQMQPAAVSSMIQVLYSTSGLSGVDLLTVSSLCSCAAAQRKGAAEAQQLLQCAVAGSSILKTVLPLRKIPAVRQLSFQRLEPIVQSALARGDQGSVYVLSEMSGLQQMPPATLLHHKCNCRELSMKAGRSAAVQPLCQLPAAHAVGSSIVADCLLKAITADVWGNMIQHLCALAAASTILERLAEASVWQLIRNPDVIGSFPGSEEENIAVVHRPIFALACVQLLRPAVIGDMLQYAVQHICHTCVASLCTLPGAKQLGRNIIADVLRTAVGNTVKLPGGWTRDVCRLCRLCAASQCAASQSEASAVAELLRGMVEGEGRAMQEGYAADTFKEDLDKFGVAVRALCSVPAATQIGVQELSSLLDMAGHKGAVACLQVLQKLGCH